MKLAFLLFALALSATCCAQTVVTLALTERETIYAIGVTNDPNLLLDNPYTFQPEDFKSAFTRDFFRRARKGRLPMFRDSSLTKPFTYSDLANEHYFLDYMLGKKYLKRDKLPDNAVALPGYVVGLYRVETWTGEQRTPYAGYLLLQDEQKPHLPGAKIFFRWTEEVPVNLLTMYCDYTAGRLGAREVIAHDLFNFRVTNGVTLPAGWQNGFAKAATARHAQLLAWRPEEKKPYNIQIPSVLGPDNFSPELLPKDAYQFDLNMQLFQQAVPVMFRLILRKKLKVYREPNKKARLAYEELVKIVEKHPSCRLPVSRKHLKQLDYSFGVLDLTLTGVLKRKNGTVHFDPEYVGIVWGDSPNDPFRSLIGYVRYRDLIIKGIEVNNQPIAKFIDRGGYYAVLYQVESAMPRHLAESFYVQLLLRTGRWEELLPQSQLSAVEEDVLRERVRKICNESR